MSISLLITPRVIISIQYDPTTAKSMLLAVRFMCIQQIISITRFFVLIDFIQYNVFNMGQGIQESTK